LRKNKFFKIPFVARDSSKDWSSSEELWMRDLNDGREEPNSFLIM
jgi:hypothetical protein